MPWLEQIPPTPLAFATSLALETGRLLQDYAQQAAFHTSLKPDKTVVTDADLAADRLILQRIRDAFPSDQILSEELNPTHPESTAPTWVIDPVDGTANFAAGICYWGVSIARVVEGWPETAALYFPAIDELYTAQKGQGAFLNGKPIHTVPFEGQPVAFFTCCSRLFSHYHVKVRFKPRILGSAAYNFCAVARGLSVLGFEATPKIWDIAASWLVLEEAGGVFHPYGAPPFPLAAGVPYEKTSFPLLAAANQAMLAAAREQIIPAG